MHTTPIDPITAEVLHAAVHDLKGPAGRLRMLSQLLGRTSDALDDDARGLLRHIENSAAEVGVVADGLRAYAEICARPVERRRIDLNEIMTSAIANLRSEIDAAAGEITVSILPPIHADPFLMTWLLRELLTNAIRFRADEPPRITVRSDDGQGFVSVLDNGPGIDAANAERVFRPFKKLGESRGAGLGLTICRQIVGAHEGRIWVEPRVGGADIRFSVGSAGAANEARP